MQPPGRRHRRRDHPAQVARGGGPRRGAAGPRRGAAPQRPPRGRRAGGPGSYAAVPPQRQPPSGQAGRSNAAGPAGPDAPRVPARAAGGDAAVEMPSPTWRTRWLIVVAVIDGPRPSLAGRVVLPPAVALLLLWSGTSAWPGMGGASPSQPIVQAAPQLPHGTLGGHVPLVRAAAGHGQRNRRDATPVAV